MDRECKQVLKVVAFAVLGGVAAWFGSVFAIVQAKAPAAAMLLLMVALWLDALRIAGHLPDNTKELESCK